MIFLVLNLFLLCENLKIKDDLYKIQSANSVEVKNLSTSDSTLEDIKVAINLAKFNGTNSLYAKNGQINLNISKNYFVYVFDELKSIIDISSMKYLNDESVLLEGNIR